MIEMARVKMREAEARQAGIPLGTPMNQYWCQKRVHTRTCELQNSPPS